MEYKNIWHSKLGFLLEFEETSGVNNGIFHLNSIRHCFNYLTSNDNNQNNLAFIIKWNINIKATTAFSGRYLNNDKLYLKWFLSVEDNSHQNSTYAGEVWLNKILSSFKSNIQSQKLFI